MNPFDQATEAIIANNSYAVQENLRGMGVIGEDDPNYYTPGALKSLIVRAAGQHKGDAAYWGIVDQALDVPINADGDFAEELSGLAYDHGNLALLRNLRYEQAANTLADDQAGTGTAGQLFVFNTGIKINDVLKIAASIALICVGIYFIRKN